MGNCCCGDSSAEIDDLPVKDGVVDFRDGHGCCRDFYCLLAIAAAAVAMIILFAVGFSQGHPKKLYAPIDKNGDFCGLAKSEDPRTHPDLEYIVYYNLSDLSNGICVEKCPTPDAYCVLKNGSVISKETVDCMLDSDSEYYVDAALKLGCDETCRNEIQGFLTNPDGLIDYLKGRGVDAAHALNFVIKDSVPLMNRCIPNIKDVLKDLEAFDGLNNVFTAAVSDLRESWWLLLVTAAITLVLCFAMICCLQLCAKCMTWLIIFAALVLIVVVGIVALAYGVGHYREPLQTDKTSAIAFIVFGAVCLLASIIMLIILIALRKSISLAATLVQEASRAIKNNLCLLLVPLAYVLIFIFFLVLMVITMVYYFSSLEVVVDPPGSTFRSIKIDKNARFLVLFVVVCFFWMTYFVIGMNTYTIAGAGSYYYFSRSPAERVLFPIARTLRLMILHHLGSIAVGSFLIALVATARAIVLYLSQKAKAAKNETLKSLLSCVQCCLGCLQKAVEFIATRAYIMMAIQGKNFWISAYDALKLMLGNPLRSALLSAISSFLVIMAEIVVTGLASIIAFIILRPDLFSSDIKPSLHVMYWWFIAFLCAVVAFFLSWIVFQIYDGLIDTIFFCFLYDEHMETKYKDNYLTYASKELRAYMDVVDNNAIDKDNGGDGNLTGGGSSSKVSGVVPY